MFLPFLIADSPIALVLNMAVEQVPRLGHRLNSGSVIEDTGLESDCLGSNPRLVLSSVQVASPLCALVSL